MFGLHFSVLFAKYFMTAKRIFADNLIANLSLVYRQLFQAYFDGENFCSKISRKIFYKEN